MSLVGLEPGPFDPESSALNHWTTDASELEGNTDKTT